MELGGRASSRAAYGFRRMSARREARHPKNHTFVEVTHDVFNFTTADEMGCLEFNL